MELKTEQFLLIHKTHRISLASSFFFLLSLFLSHYVELLSINWQLSICVTHYKQLYPRQKWHIETLSHSVTTLVYSVIRFKYKWSHKVEVLIL